MINRRPRAGALTITLIMTFPAAPLFELGEWAGPRDADAIKKRAAPGS